MVAIIIGFMVGPFLFWLVLVFLYFPKLLYHRNTFAQAACPCGRRASAGRAIFPGCGEWTGCQLTAFGGAFVVSLRKWKDCVVGGFFASFACASAISSAVAGIGQTMSRPLPKE